ncbi:MAG: sodium-independent anion transporter [Candidatus Sericytochromatia bacterium]|nr:sodium-independent anion transporter [Candidatus Sericytochromatia bacterium]
MYGHQIFSKQIRLPQERTVLERQGQHTVVFELQGSLFFGTTDRLYDALEPELRHCRYLILDMRRVQSFDISAAHMLQQVNDMLSERGAMLLFADFSQTLPTGQNLQHYFYQKGRLAWTDLQSKALVKCTTNRD